MSDSAAAFANFPSEARGALLVDTCEPLSLHTADVHVLFSGYAAQVTLSLEYVNETNRLVKAIAAYPVPPGFQLQYTTLTGPNRSMTDKVYQQSRALKTTEAGGGLPTKSLYDIMTSAVATQTVPWDISPGDSLLMASVYHAPLAQIQQQNEVAFTLPTSLFPAVTRPAEVRRNYLKATGDRSLRRHLGRAGWMSVTVEGQLYCPLRGEVTLDKGGYPVVPEGEVKLHVHYNGDSCFTLTYQDALPTKTYTQQALTVRAPVGEVMEPLRLHSVTVPPTGEAFGAAAVALTMTANLTDCPVNAELVFVMDVHTAAMAQDVAEAVAAAISPTTAAIPDSVYANVVLCSATRRNGCVVLFPTGGVPIATIARASVLAYMKEDIPLSSPKGSLASAAAYSPQLPAVLHDVLAGCNASTPVPDGYVRNVILLSDAGGQAAASDSAAMICDAASFATNTRVHCVALGPTADHAMLEILASTANGSYCCPATTTVPPDSEAAANCDLVVALRQVIAAAAVPCLSSVRTTWRLMPSSPAWTVRIAANADGMDLPCIPHHTKRVLYGLVAPSGPAQPRQQQAPVDNEGAAQAGNDLRDGEQEGEDTTPLRLNVRVMGRVGSMALEFTAATPITATADTAQQEASSHGERNGNTLLLNTAATAARIAFLSNDHHAVTLSEAQEMIALSHRCMLPSPYTTLTDGKAPFTAGRKQGSVVYMPSVGGKAQIAVAVHTRRAEIAAMATLSPSQLNK
ncbi:hypothetical protein ABL78_4695 [Leptomonas seymouri]|uniref:VWFA domain-containing protein n=1 Tax=Leptomonas seymouri TaxID=5684 RepID=A0A0N0P5B7_LEPSE|nr:hypothetical protein ABL78_4695 [Leptomonas seymouri]|eukprot:KPI86269.1 hypothetical protein ABL78_4695 [Leptomonas seymouri]